MSAKILIIGYGNILRGDDGAGCRVVEKLGTFNSVKSRCELRTFHQLLPEHSKLISGYQKLILVDASCQDAPGKVYLDHLSNSNEEKGGEKSFNAHRLSPQDVLNASQRLYGRSPDTYLCRIGGGDFGFSTQLSRETTQAVEKAVTEIRKMLMQWAS